MIIRAPLSPPLLDPNLRAGWAPRPVSGVVPDLSGHGFDGTPVVSGVVYEEDPYFGSALHNSGADAGYTFPCTLGLATQGTWGCWYRLPSLVLPAGGTSVLVEGNAAADALNLVTNGSAFGEINLTLNAVARTLTDTLVTRIDVPTLLVATYDGDRIRLYVDTLLRQISPHYDGPITSWNAGTGRVGYSTAATHGLAGWSFAPFVLDRAWTESEVAAYYVQACRACYKTGWGAIVSLVDEGGAAGQFLSNTEFQCGDAVGRWRVSLDTIGGRTVKTIECRTAGLLYLDLERIHQQGGAGAFGEWEFWHYKPGAPALSSIGLVADTIGRFDAAGQDGYSFAVLATGAWNWIRTIAGVVTYQASSPAGALATQTWHRFNVTRLLTGEFTFRWNGAVLSTASGTGTNPITDTSTLTSRYLVLYLSAGDRIALGGMDGSYSLVKRLKA